MNFSDFYKSLATRDDRERFAKAVGSSPGYLAHIASGRRKAGATLAIEIEKATRGVVRCETVCPDADWSYLRAQTQ